MSPRLAAIYRYPVKGLSPQPLERVTLVPDRPLPHDRAYALAHGASRYDAAQPAWQPKAAFLALVRNPRLARLQAAWDEATGTLSIARDGRVVCHGRLDEPTGQHVIAQFFAAYMGAEARGAVNVAAAPGLTFTDVPDPFISVIGLASVQDLGRVLATAVDHRRFRANLYLLGTRPWQEFEWVGRDLRIGDVRLRIERRIDRCAATEVNPDTGERDLDVLQGLRRGFAHLDMGVYARVLDAGTVAVGQPLSLPE